MKFDINDKNEIRIWDLDNPNELNAPFLYQPDWPDCTPWASKAEAKAWAELFIESLTNPESEFIPGDSPDEPKKLRPEPVELDPETGLPIDPAEVINEEPV